MTTPTSKFSSTETLFDMDLQTSQIPPAHFSDNISLDSLETLPTAGLQDPQNAASLFQLNIRLKELESSRNKEDETLQTKQKGLFIINSLWLVFYLVLIVVLLVVGPVLSEWVCKQDVLVTVADIARWVMMLNLVDFCNRVRRVGVYILMWAFYRKSQKEYLEGLREMDDGWTQIIGDSTVWVWTVGMVVVLVCTGPWDSMASKCAALKTV